MNSLCSLELAGPRRLLRRDLLDLVPWCPGGGANVLRLRLFWRIPRQFFFGNLNFHLEPTSLEVVLHTVLLLLQLLIWSFLHFLVCPRLIFLRNLRLLWDKSCTLSHSFKLLLGAISFALGHLVFDLVETGILQCVFVEINLGSEGWILFGHVFGPPL